ncbi:MAG: carboxypeptidase regulatory-like domain-containing protein [Nitrosopumilus sp.]|nr:carboxypeptidase regulatory-like domain-containing protein [Nitrosopumilus sp.]
MTAFSKSSDKRSLSLVKKHKNKIYLGIIVGAILIAGFLLSGGTTPNSNIGSMFEPLPVYKSGSGAINGYVSGPIGLPAVGATIIAAQQGGSASTASGFISIDGKYVFRNLPPGEYILMVAFPDGVNKVLDKVVVGSGSVQTINFNY